MKYVIPSLYKHVIMHKDRLPAVLRDLVWDGQHTSKTAPQCTKSAEDIWVQFLNIWVCQIFVWLFIGSVMIGWQYSW